MESDAVDSASGTNVDADGVTALNSTILEYYKKFGRKRDLEQYFALNTAQGDIRDLSSLFWRKMKSQESSDSGEKSRESSLEVCKISIRCTALEVDPGSSQDEKEKEESESPPIIVEEVTTPPGTSRQSDNESVKSDDYQSQKSTDVGLDTSMNKAHSPTSSVTSQRRLEWDSLADVGYANESDKKTTASSLSTLERLALQQQYSNNDNQANLMGAPTAHSTPVDENETKAKNRRNSKTTKIFRKDVDFLEVNLPHTSNSNPAQSINLNLTKHISLNVDKNGVSVKNVKKDVSYVPEKRSVETEMTPQASCDKEIQTSLVKSDKSSSSDIPKTVQLYGQAVPVLINLNTCKKRHRRKKFVAAKKKLRNRKRQDDDKENLPIHEKSNEQVSEAESFEYMPGHIYNQNRINNKSTDRSSQLAESNLTAGNKSSLESSGAVTTDSSKDTKLSFSKDLENSIKLLKATLNQRYDDSELKQKLIKKVVQRLLHSSYRDDESSTDFLSGLSFNSKNIGLRENTTTSTSDANNTTNEKPKPTRPKKSILRTDRFNANGLPSTSQSAPNLAVATNIEKPVNTNLSQTSRYSNTESDSSKEKTSSDNAFAKTSSEELYQKYLDALRREEAYKRHLKEKEMFLKTKLVSSDVPINVPARLSSKSQLSVKEIMNDLTRSNYGSEAARLDGSGDAGKLELGSVSSSSIRPAIRTDKSHSVFTLSSSGNSDPNRRANLKKNEVKDIPKASPSTEQDDYYCCCPHHYKNKLAVNDSSVQVDLKCEDTCPKKTTDVLRNKCAKCRYQPITLVPDEITGEIKYLCMCGAILPDKRNVDDNLMVYKCSRLMDQGVQSQAPSVISAVSSKPATSPRKYDCKESQTGLRESDSGATTKQRIHEAIRIVQTDISINPRISDPSISDIKIINNSDCVKLVGEQYREISKTSVESKSSADDQTDLKIGAPVLVEETSGKSNEDISPRESRSCKSEVQVQSDRDVFRQTVYGPAGRFHDNVTVLAANLLLKQPVGTNPESALDNCAKCNQASNAQELRRHSEKSEAVDTIFARKEPSIPDVSPRLQSTSSEPTPKTENITPRSKSPGPYPKAVENSQKEPESPSNNPRSEPKDECYPISPKKSAPVSVDPAQCKDLTTYRQEKNRETSAKNLATESSSQSSQPPDLPKQLPCDKNSTVVRKDSNKVSSPPVSPKRTPFHSQKSPRSNDPNIKSQTYPQKYEGKKSKSSRSQSLGESEPFHNEMFIELGKGSEECTNRDLGSIEDHNIGDSSSRERRQTGSSSGSSKKKDSKDLIMNLIQDITSRYKKKDLEKSQKRKCFKEIITVLKYLLDTEDTDAETVMGLHDLISSSTSDIEQPNHSGREVRSSRSDDYSETKTKLPNKEYKNSYSEGSQKSKAKARSEQSQNIKAKSTVREDLKTKPSPRNKEYQIMQTEEEKATIPEKKVLVDKGVQLSSKRSKPVRRHTESSELPVSSEFPGTSSESATCHVLNRIRRECDKYHQRRCKCHNTKKCECYTTSVNCDQCKRVHHCICRTYSKCKHRSKNCERLKQKCVAYNLIIQTSESMVDEERPVDKTNRTLKNIIVKVPSKKKSVHQEANDSFMTKGSPRSEGRRYRSRSLPNDSLTSEENVRANMFCVKDYLEKNRPDFIERSTNRQSRLKMISETSPSFLPCTYCYPCTSCLPCKLCSPRPMKTVIVHGQHQHGITKPCTYHCREPPTPYHPCYTPCIPCHDPCNDSCIPCNDPCESRPSFTTPCPLGHPFLSNRVTTIASIRAAQRRLVSMQVQMGPTLRSLSSEDLRALAKEAGLPLHREPPKLLSEREMKQHSSRIYRRLPEVLRKKEEAKKESVKRTNLLMANIFKKSLQKKALRGSVNLSNYSTVIKF